MQEAPVVLTIGHSTRPVAVLVDLLLENGVARLVDVRTVPRSRTNPQFDAAVLPLVLEQVGLAYEHWKALGGLRRARPDSPNGGWHNASFRGFADYMLTPAFAAAIDELLSVARVERVCVMCAEAVPWRCHRSLIADALLVRGARVEHILGPGKRRRHELTRFARPEGARLVYPPEAAGPAGAGEVLR